MDVEFVDGCVVDVVFFSFELVVYLVCVDFFVAHVCVVDQRGVGGDECEVVVFEVFCCDEVVDWDVGVGVEVEVGGVLVLLVWVCELVYDRVLGCYHVGVVGVDVVGEFLVGWYYVDGYVGVVEGVDYLVVLG